MRFFTKELWLMLNDSDESIRFKAEKEWEINTLAYQQQFAKACKHLSRSFVKSFLSRTCLHDYAILSIAITKGERTYSCELQLSNNDEVVLIAMVGIKALQIDIESFLCCVQGKLAWGYSEFEITPDHNIKLSLLCDINNEMQFEFKKIKFRIGDKGTVLREP